MNFLLNSLSRTDVIFFLTIAGVIVLAVGIYFLIPVLNRKQYQEQRENLRIREAAFKASVSSAKEAKNKQPESPAPEQKAEAEENK